MPGASPRSLFDARKLGFPKLQFRDLRARMKPCPLMLGCRFTSSPRRGHDPAILLRTCARRTKKADKSPRRSLVLSRRALGL